jgi:hypothetical protein
MEHKGYHFNIINIFKGCINSGALGGLVVSVLTTGPTVAGSGPAEECEFLWMKKN